MMTAPKMRHTPTEITLASMFHADPDDLLRAPESTLHVDEWGLRVELDTFHFLNYRLEYDEPMTTRFTQFDETQGDNRPWGEVIDEWLDSLEIKSTSGGNTYNDENALSHDFQYTQFEYNDETYVILQVHLGGDIRGNYSRPAVFQFTDQDYFYMWNRVGMGIEHQWFDSDDAGSHWYGDSGEFDFTLAPLSDLFDVDVDRAPDEINAYVRMMQDAGRDPDRQLAMGRERVARAKSDAIAKTADYNDVIFYDDEGNGYFQGEKLEPSGTNF